MTKIRQGLEQMAASPSSQSSQRRRGNRILSLLLLTAGAVVAVALVLSLRPHWPLTSLQHAFGAWWSSTEDMQTYCVPGVRTSAAAEQDENDNMMMAPNLNCYSVSAASGRLIRRSFQAYSPPPACEHERHTDRRPDTSGECQRFYAEAYTALSRAWSAEGHPVEELDTFAAALRSFGEASDQDRRELAACQTQIQAKQYRHGIPPSKVVEEVVKEVVETAVEQAVERVAKEVEDTVCVAGNTGSEVRVVGRLKGSNFSVQVTVSEVFKEVVKEVIKEALEMAVKGVVQREVVEEMACVPGRIEWEVTVVGRGTVFSWFLSSYRCRW